MKTLKTLTAALFLLISYTAFADGKPAGEYLKNSRFARAILPTLPVVFGTPEDVNSETVELLKTINLNLPDTDTAGANSDAATKLMPWTTGLKFALFAPKLFGGSPDDIESKSVESLKHLNFIAPDMNWGNPEDVNSESAKALKYINFAAPAMSFESEEDVNSETVESLKYINFPAPEMSFGSEEDVNSDSIESLKYLNFPAPDMTWGNPEDVNSEYVVSLKQVK
jgi:hypothetical protein